MNITTEIGQTTPDKITVRGLDLSTEIIGHLDFVEAFLLCAFGRRPTVPEREMVNALLVLALDHGLTPSSIAARLTQLGAPESLQGAVAAGLLGAGSRYLGPATMVSELLATGIAGLSGDEPDDIYDARAIELLDKLDGCKLPGFGHPIHKVADPRVGPLRVLARRHGFYRAGWKLHDAVERKLGEHKGLPANASGAMGATILDMGIPPSFATGVALVGRCGGLVAHLLEERQHPVGQSIWELVLNQDPRNNLVDPRK